MKALPFPLIEMDGDGYPNKKILQVTTRAIEHFLSTQQMEVFLCVAGEEMIFLGKSCIARCPIIWMHIAAAWEEVWAS
ncbi:MAG: hypothetical protein GXY67_07245 [Clostridiales bacterium]|nr:hypothetical protein [Clostridiales bacterium]